MKKYFEYIGPVKDNKAGETSKFWEISVDGTTVTIRFGKIGVAGQTTQKSFATKAEADAHAAKVIGEKTRKGYLEK
jgi:predicted DNA-binding WGR domain protein